MADFTQYSDVIFDAFRLHAKPDEIVNRKISMTAQVLEHYNLSPDSVLFVGFNPGILASKAKEIYVTEISGRVVDWLVSQGVAVKQLTDVTKKFDLVVACDEYLTFAKSESEQRDKIHKICQFSKGVVITTVKDYKNQDFKDREYSQPAIVKNNGQTTSFVEIHNWHHTDRNALETSVYTMGANNCHCLGTYPRRTLFFKQLAKFSSDSGAEHFFVHKNLMYKSLIKKNYEHIVSMLCTLQEFQ